MIQPTERQVQYQGGHISFMGLGCSGNSAELMLDEIRARCYSSARLCLTVVGAIHNMSSSVTPDIGYDGLFLVLYR